VREPRPKTKNPEHRSFGGRRRYRFERRNQGVLDFPLFLRRLGFHGLLAVGIIVAGLGVGVLGYHWIAGLGWIDALLNAAMILTGMGPVDRLETTGAKVFASLYAIFSGSVFLTAMGLLIAPILHRFLHTFHLDVEEDGASEEPEGNRGKRS
jgi:hypothetical protein